MEPSAISFYALWWRTAFSKAWAILDTASLVVGLTALALAGSDLAAQSLAQRLTWQLPLGLFAVTLLWRLCVAPLEIYRVQNRELAALRSVLPRAPHNQKLTDQLTERYHFGVHELLQRPPATLKELEAWDARVHAWTEEALEIMRGHHCTAQDLNHVETITALDLQPVPALQMDVAIRMFAVRLQRVADISRKYATKTELRGFKTSGAG